MPKVGRPKKVKGKGMVLTLYIGEHLYSSYEKILPKDKSVSAAVREIIEAKVQDEENKKKELDRTGVDKSLSKGEVVSTERMEILLKAWIELNRHNLPTLERMYPYVLDIHRYRKKLYNEEEAEKKRLEKPKKSTKPRKIVIEDESGRQIGVEEIKE